MLGWISMMGRQIEQQMDDLESQAENLNRSTQTVSQGTLTTASAAGTINLILHVWLARQAFTSPTLGHRHPCKILYILEGGLEKAGPLSREYLHKSTPTQPSISELLRNYRLLFWVCSWLCSTGEKERSLSFMFSRTIWYLGFTLAKNSSQKHEKNFGDWDKASLATCL